MFVEGKQTIFTSVYMSKYNKLNIRDTHSLHILESWPILPLSEYFPYQGLHGKFKVDNTI